MPTTCEIEFENNPLKVVYSGQVLRGNVKLSLTDSIKVRGVYIKISGEGYCHWTTGSGRNKKIYTGREDYFDKRRCFIDGREGAVRLTPGTHSYTFECMLPHLMPTSFEGEYGHIRYIACVVLDILIWPDKKFPQPFTVIKPANLNANRALREPSTAEIHKKFYPYSFLCCCKSDPLDIKVYAPVRGYTPGQTINLYIKVNNESTQPVLDFVVQLIKEIRYSDHPHTPNSSKLQTEILIEGNTTRGCTLNSKALLRANIVVPPTSPTQKTRRHIIQIEYSIWVIGRLMRSHKDITIELPIIIGTIPILDNNQSLAQMSTSIVSSQQSTSPITDDIDESDNLHDSNELSMISAPPYPSEDPPTYEEAIQCGNKEAAFTPKYPVFRQQTSYSNIS